MPASVQAIANSSAPNRLPVSVIATAGIASARHSCTSSLILIAPGRQRIGAVGAQMNEIGERHAGTMARTGRESSSGHHPPRKPAARFAAPEAPLVDRRFSDSGRRAGASYAALSLPSSSATMRSRRRARSRLCVAISAARPVSRTISISAVDDAARRSCGRDCRSARRPSRIFGSLASARTIATRCCSPPDSRAGRWSRRSAKPDAAEQHLGLAPRGGARHAGDHLRQHDVLQRRELRQQMVELIDKAERAAAQHACAARRTGRRSRAPRSAPRRHRAAPAARRHAAASICRRPTGRPARRSRRDAARGRRRSAPPARRRPAGTLCARRAARAPARSHASRRSLRVSPRSRRPGRRSGIAPASAMSGITRA